MLLAELSDGTWGLIGNGGTADADTAELCGTPAPIIPNNPTGHNILRCLNQRGVLEDFPEHKIRDWNHESLALPTDIPDNFFGDYPPYPHQTWPLAAMIKYNHFGLFLEMGLGKTYLGIQLFRYLTQVKSVSGPFLVLCPRNVISTWKRDIEKFTANDKQPLQTLCLGDQMSVENRVKFITMALKAKAPLVIVSNYETFSGHKKELFEELILAAGGSIKKHIPGSLKMETVKRAGLKAEDQIKFGAIILDESTKIKSTSTERFKGIYSIRNLSNRRYIFTGFPSPQSPADFVGQAAFLHPLYLGYSSTYQFTQDWAIKDDSPNARVTGWKDQGIETLKKQLKVFACSIRLDQTDIKLPERIYKTIAVELSSTQRSVYEQFELDYVAYVEQKTKEILGGKVALNPCEECDDDYNYSTEDLSNLVCTRCKGTGFNIGGLEGLTGQQKAQISILAQNALVKMQRLLQITGGWAVHKVVCPLCNGKPDWLEVLQEYDCKRCKGAGEVSSSYLLDPNPKMEALKELVNGQINGPYTIFSFYRHELEYMSKEFGIPIIFGGIKTHEVDRIVRDLQAGNIPGVCIQPDSGGIGINGLQVCRTAVYYTNSLKLEARVQSEKRLHRIGQQNTVSIIDLTGVDSIDEFVLDRLNQKKQVAEAILEFPKLILSRRNRR